MERSRWVMNDPVKFPVTLQTLLSQENWMRDMEPNEKDLLLIEEALNSHPGDFRAFDKIVARHQTMVRTNCRYICGNAEDAQDLTQEVFVKAFFNLSSFRGQSQFGTWLKRIKVNHCLNHLRKQKGKTHVDIEEPGLDHDERMQASDRASAGLEAREKRERIGATLDALAETLRVPLIMRDLDGLSYQEIADELGIGLPAVKMRINRARKEFRTLYEKD